MVGAGLLYFAIRHLIKDPHLYESPHGEKPLTWGVRTLLILTCTSVSFSHGTNDGQKSIGLIMLTVIGLMPATYALNPNGDTQIRQLAETAHTAAPLIQKYGDDQKQLAIEAADRLQAAAPVLASKGADAGAEDPAGHPSVAPAPGAPPTTAASGPQATRSAIRGEVYRLLSELQVAARNPAASAAEKADAGRLRAALKPTVEYAP